MLPQLALIQDAKEQNFVRVVRKYLGSVYRHERRYIRRVSKQQLIPEEWAFPVDYAVFWRFRAKCTLRPPRRGLMYMRYVHPK